MHNPIHLVVLIGIALGSMISCNQAVDLADEKKKIQAQIDLIEEAHLKKSAEQFYQPNATSFYDIRNGNVEKVNKADLIAGTQSYLDSMEFYELKKIQEPIIEISDDGTLASYIGNVVVKGRFKRAPVFWLVSWQSMLKKIDKEWKIISTANTEAPTAANTSIILQNVKKVVGRMDASGSVYAMADCYGPIGDFKTLIFSRETDGRMEQRKKSGHVILKYGDSASWGKNIRSQRIYSNLDTLNKLFVKGHEFHWLSMRPEDRFSNPVFKGFTEFNRQTSFKIEFKDALNRSVYFYYSFDDYMPLGFENPTDTQENMVQVYFSNWKEINGLKLFQNVSIEEGSAIWKYDFTEFKINELVSSDFENKNKVIVD